MYSSRRYNLSNARLTGCILSCVGCFVGASAEASAPQASQSQPSQSQPSQSQPSQAAVATDHSSPAGKVPKELPSLGFQTFAVGTFGSLDNGARIKVASIDKPLALNKMARLYVKILGIGTEELPVELTEFDARMPQHSHGMVVKPVIRSIPGRPHEFIIEGVKLHMKGEWQLHFTIAHADTKSIIVDDFTL